MATNDDTPDQIKRRELTLDERVMAFQLVYNEAKDWEPKRGSFVSTARFFSVHPKTIGRLWRTMKPRLQAHLILNGDDSYVSFCLNKDNFKHGDGTKKRGRHKKWDRQEMSERIAEIDLNDRKTFRTLANQLGIPHPTVYYCYKKEDNVMVRHKSVVKPVLTELNKVSRVMYVLDSIKRQQNGTLAFKDLYDTVHVDEKWFRLTKVKENYLLAPWETKPRRGCVNKHHISKVMFICAQARPRHDPNTNTLWDGKLGIWPIGEWVPAAINSCNRPAGTMEWKDKAVTKDVYRHMLLYHVVAAIQSKWPRGQWENPNFTIRIQQDGPKTHIKPDDALFQMQLTVMGLQNKIRIVTQPANSPDTNVNDLGFFNALQTLAWTKRADGIADLITNVIIAYNEYPPHLINRVFLTLMGVMNCIIDTGGNNDYKIPHMGKASLERRNALPIVIPVTPVANQYLNNNNHV